MWPVLEFLGGLLVGMVCLHKHEFLDKLDADAMFFV